MQEERTIVNKYILTCPMIANQVKLKFSMKINDTV